MTAAGELRCVDSTIASVIDVGSTFIMAFVDRKDVFAILPIRFGLSY